MMQEMARFFPRRAGAASDVRSSSMIIAVIIQAETTASPGSHWAPAPAVAASWRSTRAMLRTVQF